ncbi:MAG TPA: tol-pal system-associated acyl-CoA thioesterase [Alphaproteobacteria bacterium]|nr:tol-pal system-associated acyl-CoA thioesterase [Alphaproteobacteria bacterium]
MAEAAASGISAAGSLAGSHVFPVRVYYEDTDAAGIVYHANYLRFAERARTEMMRLLGIESSKLMQNEGLNFAVARCAVDYLKPARLDDALEVHTRVLEVGRASLSAEQLVKRGGALLVRIVLRLAVLDRVGRPVRLPSVIRTTLINLSQSREK